MVVVGDVTNRPPTDHAAEGLAVHGGQCACRLSCSSAARSLNLLLLQRNGGHTSFSAASDERPLLCDSFERPFPSPPLAYRCPRRRHPPPMTMTSPPPSSLSSSSSSSSVLSP
jgi:hypothetical protein